MKTINQKFENLFIFEMANNHQGDVKHGLKIISEMGKIVKEYKLNAAVKLQYRNLDTFIHPNELNNKDNKHVERFLSTKLKNDEFKILIDAIKAEGMVTVCTPFDESSVDLIVNHEIDIIKIASCSADDWPLITKIVSANKTVIASTGGLQLFEIDNLVSYLTNRLDEVGILHCVGIYPTPNKYQNLRFINKLISRYDNVTIGYSGHEDPDNYDVVKIAAACGARIFERHVGVETDTIKLNKYSMNPSQVRNWIQSHLNAEEILGEENKIMSEPEKESLLSLKRGVFVNKAIPSGEQLKEADVFFAFPISKGQLSSGEFGKVRAKYLTSKEYKLNEGVYEDTTLDPYHRVRKIIHEAKGWINENNIILGDAYDVELSHHYGIENFEKFGCLIVNVLNREYCKKIIVVYPGQSHPEQKHLKKEETFHILNGELTVCLNGVDKVLKKGDVQVIERGVTHSFSSDKGAILEEISTTHHRDDSFYTDPTIAQQDPMQRKTIVGKF